MDVNSHDILYGIRSAYEVDLPTVKEEEEAASYLVTGQNGCARMTFTACACRSERYPIRQ